MANAYLEQEYIVEEHPELREKKEPRHILIHKGPPNLESVLTYHEEIPYGVERHYANSLDAAFAPCRVFMISLFRFPLHLNVREDYSREFTYSWKSFRGLLFFFTSGLILLNGIIIALR